MKSRIIFTMMILLVAGLLGYMAEPTPSSAAAGGAMSAPEDYGANRAAIDLSGNEQDAIDPATIDAQNAGSVVFVGAGDIAECGSDDDEATATLLDGIPGTVFTIGDNAYPDGTPSEFTDCYHPTWGRHKARTYPAVGDNEYNKSSVAEGHFGYYGAVAGNQNEGYYSFDLGSWHIIVLNSNCSKIDGCGPNDPQGLWLKADLAANLTSCILAIHHEPLFSSNGGDLDLRDFWEPLYNAGADIVLSGHRHHYERFAQQDPDGTADPGRGIRQFVVGTGGAHLSNFDAVAPNSEVQNDDTHGVIKLTLHPTSYDWQFIPVAGKTFTDSGSTNCVPPPIPKAVDDDATTVEDIAVNIPVVANDDFGANGPSTSPITIFAPPTNGEALVNNGGTPSNPVDDSVDYTPSPFYFGTDSFTYQICDATADCDTGVVTITITPAKNRPVANDDSDSAPVNVAITINVTANDTDVDGNLNPASTNTSCPTCSLPAHGSLFNNGNGTFTYTPNLNYAGIDTFTYQVCDTDLLCDTAVVSVNVTYDNIPPQANNDAPTTLEDTLKTINVAANDIDYNGNLNPASTNTTCPTCSLPAHGSLFNNGNGTFNYTPSLNFNGTDSFVYQICDTPGACNTATVNITITPDNDPPVANDDSGDTAMNTAVTIDVVANDTDVDLDLDPASANTDCSGCSRPSKGSLINNGDGTFTYAPDPYFSGSDSFTYEVCDSDLLLPLCATADVSITVRFVNSPPQAMSDILTIPEDTPLKIDVAANDIDLNGDLDPASANTDCPTCSLPANGSLSNNGDGTFNYTPHLNFNGSDRFVYEICDDPGDCNRASVSITITATNDAPVANADSKSTAVNTVVVIDVVANDTDVDGNLNPASAKTTCPTCSLPANGSLANKGYGKFEYKPNPSYKGADSFVYEVCDTEPLCDTTKVTIIVVDGQYKVYAPMIKK